MFIPVKITFRYILCKKYGVYRYIKIRTGHCRPLIDAKISYGFPMERRNNLWVLPKNNNRMPNIILPIYKNTLININMIFVVSSMVNK